MLWLLLAVGCTHDTIIGDWEVASARLEGPKLSSVAIIAGGREGSADLVIEPAGGDEPVTIPVHLGGGMLGAVLDVVGDPIGGTTDLGVPAGTTADDLLRTYHGRAATFVIGGGVDSRALTNSAGVEIDETQFAIGIGIMASYQWLKIRVEDEATVPEDSGDTGG